MHEGRLLVYNYSGKIILPIITKLALQLAHSQEETPLKAVPLKEVPVMSSRSVNFLSVS